MVKTRRNSAQRALSILIGLALILGVFSALIGLRASLAYADENKVDYTKYTAESMHPSNNNFGSASGSGLKTPDSWTAGGVAGTGTGGAFGGVMMLNEYQANKEHYKLDAFAPGGTPDSPFGVSEANKKDGQNRNVLLVQIPEDGSSGAAYGYTSSSITITANRYYEIKVWVRTCDFVSGGAAIRLNGLGDDVAFNNINTIGGRTSAAIAEDANRGWEEFTFYIAASSYANQTMTIGLQVGDRYEDEENGYYKPAYGYAMFDNVQVYQIAPSSFLEVLEKAKRDPVTNEIVQQSHTIIKDYSAKTSKVFTDEGITNLDFTNNGNTGDPAGWLRIAEDCDPTGLPIGVFNYKGYDDDNPDDNKYHLSSNPSSALVDYNNDTNILVLSSYRENEGFQSVSIGYSTPRFTLKRYRFYRMSAWVKTQDVEGGSGATLALSVIRNPDKDEYKDGNLHSTITSCTGDADNRARGGFKQYSFYVKGSALRDYQASFECRLGTEDGKSKGIAMFDNVTLEEITPKQYADNSGNGTVVNLDTDGGYITFPSTGVTNGEFYEADYQVDDYADFAYPLAPASWTRITAQSAGNTGYSANEVKTDDEISGLIPTDAETFNAYQDKFAGAANPRIADGNVLMLCSTSDTAFGYRSSTFTVTADTPGHLTVNLQADDLEGYGASLVLKNDANVLATIEGIKNTNGFKTYSFYIEPQSSDLTLSVEIWLGGLDRDRNRTKLSSGHLFVQRVAYANIEDDKDGDTVTKSAAEKFKEFKQSIDSAKHLRQSVTAAAYSCKTIDFAAYDYYENGHLKTPYDWSLTVNGGDENLVYHGVFDPLYRPAQVPSYFTNTKDAAHNNVLLLFNAVPAYSKLAYNGSVPLKADNYYKIDVSVKVDIPDEANRTNKNAKGAAIMLLKDGADTKYYFDDVFTTVEQHDETVVDEFRTYTFYVAAGSADCSVSLQFSIGGDAASTRCEGRLYVNSITYTDITNVTYDDAVAQINNGTFKYALKSEMSDASPEETPATDANATQKSTLDWWLIPSILFAVAILIAIVGFVIRKLLDKRSKKKGVVEKTASYDRRNTLNETHNQNADEADRISDTTTDESYNAFDEDAPVEEKKPTRAPKAETPAVSPAAEEAQEPDAAASDEEAPATDENAESPATEETAEKTEKPEDEKTTEKASEKPDAFLDAFDD